MPHIPINDTNPLQVEPEAAPPVFHYLTNQHAHDNLVRLEISPSAGGP